VLTLRTKRKEEARVLFDLCRQLYPELEWTLKLDEPTTPTETAAAGDNAALGVD
jgi:hypothetical protein